MFKVLKLGHVDFEVQDGARSLQGLTSHADLNFPYGVLLNRLGALAA